MDLELVKVKAWLEMLGIKGFAPITRAMSEKWKNWVALIGPTTCEVCIDKNGTIYDTDRLIAEVCLPPVHPNCKCKIVAMKTIVLGSATIDNLDGADYSLKRYKRLPKNYVTKNYAEAKGWVSYKGNLQTVLSNAVIGGDLYKNRDGKLPASDNRIWHEADLNYSGGRRNKHRILYSNDGLLFVTYDHYKTFYEIV